MMTSRINLGDKARDTITGFEGICVCRSEFVSGCTRIALQPAVGQDGKIPEQGHFDEPMLMVVAPAVVPAQPSDRGGPRPAPSQHAAPQR
jgi:hypothetical protein